MTFPSFLTLSRDTSTRDYAEPLLAHAPPNAVILTSWHWATPLWYLQAVEQQRPDVEIRYVYPRTASLAQDWVTEIANTLPTRPVIVTSFYPEEFGATLYRFLPYEHAWQVLATGLTAPPQNLAGAQKINDLEFSGYQLAPAQALAIPTNVFNPRLSPSIPLIDVTAAWRISDAPRDISFFVQLIGPDGLLYGQQDFSYSASRYTAGEVLLNRYHIVPNLNVTAGTYQLIAGAYLPNGERLATVPLQSIDLPDIRVSIPNRLAVPLGYEMYLLEAKLSATQLKRGDTLNVETQFLAARAITNDYAIGLHLQGNGWRVQADGTPASGAIPSLKWIANSRITDRRQLIIPTDAPFGPATLTLIVYDSFTQQALPILDPEIAGKGTAIDLGTIEILP